jgi:PAS domain S-box-containing protein
MTVGSLEGFRLMEVNESFVATTGYAAAEVVARNASQLDMWADPKAYGRLEALLKAQGNLRNYEIQLRTKEGALIDCLASAETVTIHGQPCILGVLQDITERKRSEVELIAAIEAVMQNTSWFSRTVIEKLAQIRQPHNARRGKGELADLTSREREVLGLMCQGQSDQEIAATLHLSRHTIRNHVATLYGKIHVHRRSAAIVWARERGVIGYEKPKRRKARSLTDV